MINEIDIDEMTTEEMINELKLLSGSNLNNEAIIDLALDRELRRIRELKQIKW